MGGVRHRRDTHQSKPMLSNPERPWKLPPNVLEGEAAECVDARASFRIVEAESTDGLSRGRRTVVGSHRGGHDGPLRGRRATEWEAAIGISRKRKARRPHATDRNVGETSTRSAEAFSKEQQIISSAL